MNTQHTPGPWQLRNAGRHFQQIIGGGFVVADVKRTNAVEEMERAANARLIAAAPDLLAALSKCEETLRRYSADNGHGVLAECAEARAAIAKATEGA